MTIYINKEITIEDYEVEIELNESEILEEMDSDAVLDYVIDNYPVENVLDKCDTYDIVNWIVNDKNKTTLVALLRKLADKLDM